MLEEFLKEIVAYYPAKEVSPGLQISWIERAKGYYVAVHRFPAGVASRTVVAKATEPTLEAALTNCRDIWRNIVTEEQAAKAGVS